MKEKYTCSVRLVEIPLLNHRRAVKVSRRFVFRADSKASQRSDEQGGSKKKRGRGSWDIISTVYLSFFAPAFEPETFRPIFYPSSVTIKVYYVGPARCSAARPRLIVFYERKQADDATKKRLCKRLEGKCKEAPG